MDRTTLSFERVAERGEHASPDSLRFGLNYTPIPLEGERFIVLVAPAGGNTVAVTSSFGFLPDKGLGVVILANAETANPALEQIRSFVFDLAFGDFDRGQLSKFGAACGAGRWSGSLRSNGLTLQKRFSEL